MPRKSAAASDGDLRREVAALRQEVDALKASRPGRKAKPMVALREHDVCAIDPERDSHTCPDASIFRYQMGCHGQACRQKQHESYVRRKARKVAATKKAAVKNAPAKKKATKAVPVKAPTKKVAAKKATAKQAPARRPASLRTAALAGK